MPRPIQKDSLSRCENPSMLYDAVRNPATVYKAPVQAVRLSKDVLETKQQRLNREMMEKLQSNSFRLPHQTYVVVAQVGKYVFMAIMLPPYLLLYGIPKWLLQGIFPQLFEIAKGEYYRVGRFLTKCSKRVTDLMKGVMAQMIGDSLKSARDKAKHVLRIVMDRTKEMIKSIKNFSDKFYFKVSFNRRPFKNHFDIANQRLEKFLAPVKKGMKATHAAVKKKIKAWSTSLASQFSKKIAAPIKSWIAPKLDSGVKSMRARSQKVLKILESTIQKAKKSIATPFEKSREAAKAVAAFIVPLVTQTAQPVINLLAAGWENFNQVVKRAKSRVAKIFAGNRTKKVNRKIVEAVAKATDTFKFFKQQVSTFIKTNSMIKRLWKKRDLKFLKKKFNPFKKIALWLRQVMDSLYPQLIRFGSFLKDLLNRYRAFLKQAPRRIFASIQKASVKIRNFMIQSGYALQITMAFLIALFTYGMMLVHELTLEILTWVLPIKKVKT